MKKFIFLMLIMLSAVLGVNAQVAYEKAKILDNTYVGLFGGATTNLDFNSVFPVNAQAGLKVGKNFTPVFGANIEGLTMLGTANFAKSHTAFKAINVGLNGTVNLTNLFLDYNANKTFELVAEAGIGWLTILNDHNLGGTYGYHDNDELTAKTGLAFVWNLGQKKAWQLYAEPVIYWNLTNGFGDEVHFNKHNAQIGLQLGVAYKFKTSNGTHNFKAYNVGDMQHEINDLRAQLAKKPTVVTKEVIKEVVHEVSTTDATRTIYFTKGSATLSNAAKKTLNALGQNEVVIVKGFADEVGSEKFNQALSEKRAKVVADFLTNRGLKVNSAVGYGETGTIVARVVTVETVK